MHKNVIIYEYIKWIFSMYENMYIKNEKKHIIFCV